MRKSGGPVAWLRRRAPGLLPLFPAGPTESEFFAESLDGWLDGAARLKECGMCPEHGGACAGTNNAWTDGKMLQADAELGLRAVDCPKWAKWEVYKVCAASGVPVELCQPESPEKIQGYDDNLAGAFAEAKRSKAQHLYFITGGDARKHRKALVSIAYALAVIYQKSFWYDWSSHVIAMLIDEMNKDDAVDVRHKLKSVPILALDHLNPKGWKPFFVEAMDSMIYARSGKATVIASSRPLEELSETFPLSSALFERAITINVS